MRIKAEATLVVSQPGVDVLELPQRKASVQDDLTIYIIKHYPAVLTNSARLNIV